MTDVDERRQWPPVYDEASLKDVITDVIEKMPKQFYAIDLSDPDPLQGDIIELDAEVPVIDADGDVAADERFRYWLVTGNTCDAERAIQGVIDYVSIVPLVPLLELDADPRAVREYRSSRTFFVPPWNKDGVEYFADFTRFASVHRENFGARVTIRARLRLQSWILLNACLVRLLCRTDKRYGQEAA